MTKICAIGDSHIGPLKAATRLDNFPSSYKVTFFAAHQRLMRELMLQERTLVAPSKEISDAIRKTAASDCINIDEFDQFIIIGLGFGIQSTAMIYYHYTNDRMSDPAPGKFMLSDVCFAELAERRSIGCTALKIAELIRSVSDVPLTLVATPNPGEGLPKERIAPGSPPYHQISRNGDDAEMASVFRQVCTNIAKKYRISVLPPIPEVAANGVFNKREFSLLPEVIDLNSGVDYNNEMVHAGGDYRFYLAKHLFGIDAS